MILLRILILLGSITLGVLILRYNDYLVRLVGPANWAERYLKFWGGSYLMWKLIGILVIIAGVYFSIRGF